MTNSTITSSFLNAIDLKTKNEILSNIANHYGITNEEAYQAVTHVEAEDLLDYVTGNFRAVVSVRMQKFRKP